MREKIWRLSRKQKVKSVDTLNDKVNSHYLEFKNSKQVVEQIDDAFKKLVNERLENVVENTP